MTVTTMTEAWEKARELFGGSCVLNKDASRMAGYKIYSREDDPSNPDHISDLNDRLEVNVGYKSYNIWIVPETNKPWNDKSLAEREALLKKLEAWLSHYTDKVAVKVLARIDKITSDRTTMKLLNELYIREQREKKAVMNSIANIISDPETFTEYGIHSSMEHSGSYREVLYDMYIREI